MSNYHPEDAERMEFIHTFITDNMLLPKTTAWSIIDVINLWNHSHLTVNVKQHIKSFEGKVIEE